ncbi:MAG: (2Fe-2S)-binding protein [Clostridia bacterium]
MEQETIICRCEEITKSEILEAIKKGDTTVDAIKKRTRSGMGLCQGKTCGRLVAQIIAQEIGIAVADQPAPSKRPPVGVISLKELAASDN